MVRKQAVKNVALEMARASNSEDGCLCYEFSERIDKPGCFRVFEEWADQAALAAHFQSPHMAKFRQAMSEIRVLSRAVHRYEVSSSEAL